MKKRHLPVPGQRILRTAVAVWLCFAAYLLRGRVGMPIFSAIAAITTIRPYTKDMRGEVQSSILGTVLGAAWGLLLLLAEKGLAAEGLPDEPLHYLLLSVTVALVLYSTVLLRLTDMATTVAIVFLSVAITPLSGSDPYLYSLQRLLDTVIGLLIAELVNRLQLPRAKHTDTLFVSAIDHAILDSGYHLSPYSKVELNRLIEDGAKITVATVHSQATVRELLDGVHLPYPIITSDGAALYNMDSLEYLRTNPMSPERAERALQWVRQQKLGVFAGLIEDNLLVIRYRELSNPGMEQQFRQHRQSAYRNFVHSGRDVYENVIYLMVLDRTERVEECYPRLMAQSWAGEYRVVKDPAPFAGYSYLKIYDASTSREAMLRQLEALLGTTKTVTLGGVPGKYDVYIENSDRDSVVKEIRRRFEPVDFRKWKSIFRR